jgi:hypothetical protein
MVTGLFDDRDRAERAYQSLTARGYTKDDVNLVMSDETRKKHFSDDRDSDLGDKAWEDAGKGAAIGGITGATLAAIAAIGTTVALPGLGLLIAGPIAAGIAGAGAGGLTGGLIGALVGHGVPKEHAEEYESGIKNGGVFMGVNPRSDEDAAYFENEWKNHGRSVHAVGTGAGAVGGAATGAAIGTAVAPGVGTAAGGVVGAVAGGIAGGAAGHEIAEKVNPQPGDEQDDDHAVGTGTGAVGGAVGGAALGTAIAPGVGTAIGGVAGGIAGAAGGHEVAEHVNPDDDDRKRD